MTFENLLNKVCALGRASAQLRETGYKLEGALMGFNIAATAETPLNLEQLLIAEREADCQATNDYDAGKIDIDEYWRQRYCTLQVEWVFEVVNGWHKA
jgi:hypothetical protein